MNWSFAIVNGRLAEVFFDKKKDSRKHVFAHAYVRQNDYKKEGRKWIAEDTKRARFSYRNKQYKLVQS